MALRVAINGFGRIGRCVLRLATLEQAQRKVVSDEGIEIVAINDLTDAKTLAHLLKYDSVHGTFPGEVSVDGENIVVNGKAIKVLALKNPAELPWKEMMIDIVLEAECGNAVKKLVHAFAEILVGAQGNVAIKPVIEVDRKICRHTNLYL